MEDSFGGFITPMFAKPVPADFHPEFGKWVAEEKLDGHRIIVQVTDHQANLFGGRLVRAWSRNGIERVLPPHIRETMEKFPTGLYDGELLVPGERSYGTVVLENSAKLVYVMFDVLNLLGKDLTTAGILATYDERRAFLKEMFLRMGHPEFGREIRLSWIKDVTSMEQVMEIAKMVWAHDGEGLVLKRRDSLYTSGERPKNTWLKIKKLQSAVLTVIAFREGKLGPNSVVWLRDDEGCETTVKWKNFAELAAIDADPSKFIGRKLRIEFQERTADGSYRHPRWDRWEDE